MDTKVISSIKKVINIEISVLIKFKCVVSGDKIVDVFQDTLLL